MTFGEFQILDKSARLMEYTKSKDEDILRYCISRSFSMPYDKVKNEIKIDVHFIRHTITLEAKPEILIKILSILPQLKLNAISVTGTEVKFDLNRFFNSMI